MSVCLRVTKDFYNAEPKRLSSTEELLIGPAKVYDYFGGEYRLPLKKKCLPKTLFHFFKIMMEINQIINCFRTLSIKILVIRIN